MYAEIAKGTRRQFASNRPRAVLFEGCADSPRSPLPSDALLPPGSAASAASLISEQQHSTTATFSELWWTWGPLLQAPWHRQDDVSPHHCLTGSSRCALLCPAVPCCALLCSLCMLSSKAVLFLDPHVLSPPRELRTH